MVNVSKVLFIKKFGINIGIFACISLIITFLSLLVPKGFYNYKNRLYQERKWEKHGQFYQNVFKVKKWKKRMPELADFLKFIFPKKHIKEFESGFISKYLLESCKAEFTHWCIIFSSIIFLFYDNISSFIYMLIIAIVLNLPFIIIQRYNRPRILFIIEQKRIKI